MILALLLLLGSADEHQVYHCPGGADFTLVREYDSHRQPITAFAQHPSGRVVIRIRVDTVTLYLPRVEHLTRAEIGARYANPCEYLDSVKALP
jgi:hypothetical protein